MLLNNYGFTYAFENVNILCHKDFIILFKQRVTDSFLQSWYSDIERSCVLGQLFRHIKQNFEMEFYLLGIISRRIRVVLTKLRVSSHNLTIESGRYERDRVDLQLK